MADQELSDLGAVIKTAYEGENPGGRVYMSTQGAGPSKTEAENQTALQDALDLIATMMGGDGTIFFDVPGEYDILTASKTSGINNIAVDGVPGVILNGENVDHTTSAGLIELSGTALSTTTLTAAVAKGDTVLTVASTTGLVAGMPFYIRSDTEYFNGATGVDGFSLVRKMEMNLIKSVDSGTQITLQNPTEDSYSITGYTVTLTPFTPVKSCKVGENIFWKGGGIKATLVNGSGQCAIKLSLFLSADFSKMRAGGWQNAVTRTSLGFDQTCAGGSIYGLDDQMPSTNFYGHVADGVRKVVWRGIFARNMRRLADTGTSYITRHFKQHDNIGENFNGSGVGSHHGDIGEIYSNHIWNAATGITVRSKNTHVYRNVMTCNGFGVVMGNSSVTAPTSVNNMGICSITDNVIFTSSGSARNGVRYSLGFDSLTVERNKIYTVNATPIFGTPYYIKDYHCNDNECHVSTGSSSINGAEISNTGSILATIDGIHVGKNTFVGTFGSVIKIAEPNSGSQIENLYIESQQVVGSYTKLYDVDRTRVGTNINIASGQLLDGALSGFRNLIINGMGLVNERQGTSSNVTSATAYPLDRWALTAATQSLRMSVVTGTVPSEDAWQMMRVQTRLAPAGTPAAADKYTWEQAILGVDFAALKWGTENALPLTLQFYVRPVTDTSGNLTFTCALQNAARDRSYVKTFVANNGNVGLITLTFPGDQSGTWATDSATAGARLVFDLGCGSDFETTADAWQAGNYCRVSGAHRLITNAQFRTYDLTDIQIQRGANPFPFERRPLAIERSLCRPFFQRRPVYVPALPEVRDVEVNMLAAASGSNTSGGGAGIDFTGSTAGTMVVGQTAAGLQTLLINNEPAF